MRTLAVALALVVVCSTVASPAATANEPPLADAGLDQTVERGTTVYLDATGSRDPDGSIAAYNWTITTPSGATITPDCRTCARTSFVPTTIGTYRVTVTVTDDDGATASDTLYVTVTPGSPPSISVAGPATTNVGIDAVYTATVSAGDAALETVTWSVDGTTVETTTVSGDHTRVALSHVFGTPGTHRVAATVTDADGQTATDSMTVTVEPDPSARNQTGNGTSSPGANRSLADRHAPTVRGPVVVTGSEPLDATYHVDTDSGLVRSVEWWRDGRSVDGGRHVTTAWSPGRHTLYAVVTYVDGSRTVARFSDGSTTVEADPEPSVSLARLDDHGGISGTASATDAFGNLQRVAVSIDGERVTSKSLDPLELRDRDRGSRLDLAFDHSDATPEQPHTVTLHAWDARGQHATYSTNVTPTGTPEIVKSEFVNGPVDSYHEKLDPERYAAHHVLKVDLNGVNPEEVSVSYSPRYQDTTKAIDQSEFQKERQYDPELGLLTIHTYWAGKSPDRYEVRSRVGASGQEEVSISSANFRVTPSKPEIRVDVVSDGTPHRKDNWGIVVDASESFDPDGTQLTYIWGGGAEAITNDNTTAKFDSMQTGTLKVKDGDRQIAVFGPELFLHYYTPEVANITEVSDGPYRPNETVVFKIQTKQFRMPKRHYYDDFNIHMSLNPAGRIKSWGVQERAPTDDLSERDSRYYAGTVEVSASAFEGAASPEAVLYNSEAPEQSRLSVELPTVRVLERGDRRITNVSVESVSYLVREPVIQTVETPYQDRVEEYESRGYDIVDSSLTGTRYVLEKRVKVQDAEFRTEKQRFDSRARRNVFLDQNPDWERGTIEIETKRWTTTEHEWRDSKHGNGTFTGKTRRVLIDPAEYRTKKQFRYEYQVQRTGTRTVTRTTTVRVPVTRYKWVTRCTAYGCYRTSITYTDWVTRTRHYQVTETYQYTVTMTDTYWAFGKRSPSDEYTGRSRRVKVEPAEYETQYQYEYQAEHQKTVRFYTAEREVLVQPARYEWQEFKTTKSQVVAESVSKDPDKRIGDREPARVWELEKQTGSELRWTSSPSPEDTVEKTNATIAFTVQQEWVVGDATEVREKPGTEQLTFEGYRDRLQIRATFKGKIDQNNRTRIV